MGLHQGSDGAEPGVVDGGDKGDSVCGLKGWAARCLCEMGKAVVDDLTQAMTPGS